MVIMGMLNGSPYELFAGEQEDLYLPKSVKDGIIKKNGGGKYSLVVHIRKNEVEYKDIANSLMSSEQRAITRMISLSLRHGAPIEFITSQLKKSKDDITDFASAVSRVLDKYSSDIDVSEECPVCGEPMMKQEGCIKCVSCYYSRCG